MTSKSYSLCLVDVRQLLSVEKAKKVMLAHATFVPPRRRKVSLGLPTISFEGFACFVAEVRNKKVDPYIYASYQLLASWLKAIYDRQESAAPTFVNKDKVCFPALFFLYPS